MHIEEHSVTPLSVFLWLLALPVCLIYSGQAEVIEFKAPELRDVTIAQDVERI
jgi:hypothetical protein